MHESHNNWGAFIWRMENVIEFNSSTTSVHVYTNGTDVVTNLISQVLVGSMGDYPPETTVNNTGPTVNPDNPVANTSTSAFFKADMRAFYELAIIKVDLDGDNEEDGDIDNADDVKENNMPVIVALNEDSRELVVRTIGVSEGTLKITQSGEGKVILKYPSGATILSETQSESIDILPDVITTDLTITLEGYSLGTVNLNLNYSFESKTSIDLFKAKVVKSDVVQRIGNPTLNSLLGETYTHSGIDWGKKVTDAEDPGVQEVTLSYFESRASDSSSKRRLRLKDQLFMGRRIWAKVHDNLEAQDYALPIDTQPWNLFTSSDDYVTANCNEFAHEQFQKAVSDVFEELTVPEHKNAYKNIYYNGTEVKNLATANSLSSFSGRTPTAGPAINLLVLAVEVRSKIIGAPTTIHNTFEGQIVLYNLVGTTRYEMDDTIPWYLIPFATLMDEAQIDTYTPDSFSSSSFFESITY